MPSIVDVLKAKPEYIGANGRSDEEISRAENALGLSFAKDYRKYLSAIGLACFDGHELTGLTKTARLDVVSVTMEKRERFGDFVTSLYVVEEANIDGIVIWQGCDGTVYEATPNSKVKKIASSLSEYIQRN